MDMTISKRGISLEPLGRTSQIICHAHLLFICIVYSNSHVDDLKTVVKELDKTRQRKGDLSPWYLNSWGMQTFKLLTYRNARCKNLNDDHYILCIVVCTCNLCSPPTWLTTQSWDNNFIRVVKKFTFFSTYRILPET